MIIDRIKLLELYLKEVDEISEVCDWKTNFTPKEIVGMISSILEDHEEELIDHNIQWGVKNL